MMVDMMLNMVTKNDWNDALLILMTIKWREERS